MTTNANQPADQFAAQLQAATTAIQSFVTVVNAAAQNIHQASQSVSGNAAVGSQGVAGTTPGGKSKRGPWATGAVAAGKSIVGGASVGGAVKKGLTTALMAAGPAGIAVVALSVAATKATGALDRLGEASKAYNRQLSQASASMALVFAQRDFEERLRNREKGDRLANSAKMLNDAEQRKEEQRKEGDIFFATAGNLISSVWENAKAEVFRRASPLFAALNKLVDNTNPNRPLSSDQWAQKIADEAKEWQDDWHRSHPWEPVTNDRGFPGAGAGDGDAFR